MCNEHIFCFNAQKNFRQWWGKKSSMRDISIVMLHRDARPFVAKANKGRRRRRAVCNKETHHLDRWGEICCYRITNTLGINQVQHWSRVTWFKYTCQDLPPLHLICQMALLFVRTVLDPAWPLSIEGATKSKQGIDYRFFAFTEYTIY